MIKHITEEDIEKALKLGKELHNESPIFNKYKWDDKRAKEFAHDIISDDTQCGILEYNGDELVGMLFGYVDRHYFSNDISLQEHFIYVKDTKRGAKTVFKLIKEWASWGAKLGAKDIWVYCNTGIDYKKANTFFKKIGFKVIGTQLRRG